MKAVLESIRERGLLRPGMRTGVAVSGGTDSVALLRLLLEHRTELGVVLAVVHFHHGIRGAEADADERFVCDLAAQHGLPLHSGRGDAPAHAKQHGLSLETAARDLRYRWFTSLMDAGALDAVATAHTADDQAETVLMRLLRGSGTRGLAGIHPRLTMARGVIVRPLLELRRSEVETYLRSLGQAWREDASNRDREHLRNRIRHELLPLLERDFNPQIVRALGETAALARDEEDYWQAEVARHLPAIWDAEHSSIRVAALRDRPVALERALLRAAAEQAGFQLGFRDVEALRRLMGSKKGEKACTLPGGWWAELRSGRLIFLRETKPTSGDYEYALHVPGEVAVRELGTVVRASMVTPEAAGAAKETGYNSTRFLDPRALGEAQELTVRNWRAGDRYHPARSKAAHKVKELLQGRRIALRERKRWPVVARGGEILWMRGFPPPAEYAYNARSAGRGPVLLIEEL